MNLTKDERENTIKYLQEAIDYLLSQNLKKMEVDEKNNCARICLLANEMHNITNTRPLTDAEQTKLKKELKKVFQPRYNNYKNGTTSKGRQVQEPATLRFHYTTQLTKKIDDLCEQMKDGRSVLCNGVSSGDSKNDTCEWSHVINPHELHMENFILDHWYEKEKFNTVMATCLDTICKSKYIHYTEGRGILTAAYIKQHFNDPAETDVQKTIMAYLVKHIDIELYKDDLYGDNLVLRCQECNKKSKPSTKHPVPSGDRYLLVKY